MESLTIFYIIAAIVIVGLIVYYMKQKKGVAGPKENAETPPSEGPET